MLGRKAKIHKRRTKAVAGLPDPDNPPQPREWRSTPFRDRWPGNDPYV
jgi:hypothetical protein